MDPFEETHIRSTNIRTGTLLVQFGSVQDGIYALGNANMRSIQSRRSFPILLFKTIPIPVSLTMTLSRNFQIYSATDNMCPSACAVRTESISVPIWVFKNTVHVLCQPKFDRSYGVGFFLACEDFGRMFDNSVPVCVCFLFLYF